MINPIQLVRDVYMFNDFTRGEKVFVCARIIATIGMIALVSMKTAPIIAGIAIADSAFSNLYWMARTVSSHVTPFPDTRIDLYKKLKEKEDRIKDLSLEIEKLKAVKAE